MQLIATSSVVTATNADHVTVSVPSSRQSGDLLVFVVGSNVAAADVTGVSGWGFDGGLTNSSPDMITYVYSKESNGAETTATFDIDFGTSGFIAFIAVFRPENGEAPQLYDFISGFGIEATATGATIPGSLRDEHDTRLLLFVVGKAIDWTSADALSEVNGVSPALLAEGSLTDATDGNISLAAWYGYQADHSINEQTDRAVTITGDSSAYSGGLLLAYDLRSSTEDGRGAPWIANRGQGYGSSSLASMSVFYPDRMQVGDVLFAMLLSLDNQTHSSSESGWTKIAQQNQSTGLTASLWWKRVDGSEDAAFSVSKSGASAWTGLMCRLDGCVASGTPYEGYALTSATDTQMVTSPTTVVSGKRRKVLRFVAINANELPDALTGWNEHGSLAFSVTPQSHFLYAKKALRDAGTEAAIAPTLSVSTAEWICFGLAVIPAVENVPKSYLQDF